MRYAILVLKGETNKSGGEIGVRSEGRREKEVIGPNRQVEFLSHAVDVLFTIAGDAEEFAIVSIIYNVVQLV
jgi:hypothetical protein